MIRTVVPAAFTASLIVAAALAACGGEERRDLVADADRLCTDAAIEEERVRREAGALRTNEELGALLRDLAPVRHELGSEVAGLNAPDHLVGVLAALGAGIRDRARLSELAAESARRSDPAFRRRVAAMIASRARIRGTARALGMEECAEAVPAEAREELEEAVDELLVEADAEQFCESLVSERFLIESWGGPQRCRREREGERRARRATLTHAVGIPDVRVEVAVRRRGVPAGPARIGLRLVFEGGRYKLDGVGLPGRTILPLPGRDPL